MAYPTAPTAAGTKILITTKKPATHNAAGFGAITAATGGDPATGWVGIGYLTSAGGTPKPVRSFKEVELLNGTTLVIPQTEKMAELNPEAVFEDADLGQNAVEASCDGKTLTFYQWILPNGAKIFAAGYSTGYAPVIQGPNDEVGASWTIKPIFDDQGVGPVRVAGS